MQTSFSLCIPQQSFSLHGQQKCNQATLTPALALVLAKFEEGFASEKKSINWTKGKANKKITPQVGSNIE